MLARLRITQSDQRLTNADLMLGFGDRLRWLREEYQRREPGKHGQGEWARWIGVSHTMYNRWEMGRALPKLIHLVRMVDLFQVSTEYLLRGLVGPPMAEWMRAALMSAHPWPALQSVGTYVDQRDEAFEKASQAVQKRRRRNGKKSG